MRLNVFGREVEVIRRDGHWYAAYIGDEGKQRPADDIAIPDELGLAEIPVYVADLCHEWATPKHDRVIILD